MRKNLVLTLVSIMLLSVSGIAFAQENADFKSNSLQKNFEHKLKKHHHRDFGDCGKMDKHKFHPSKAEMEKKKAEIDKRLNLTDEQKKQIEESRKIGHEQVKPLFEQKHAKIDEIRKIKKDTSLTQEQKKEKIESLRAEIKKLNEQANSYREENMKKFEAVLTDKQKKEFHKIKEEQKKEMEKHRAKFEKEMEQIKNSKEKEFAPPSEE